MAYALKQMAGTWLVLSMIAAGNALGSSAAPTATARLGGSSFKVLHTFSGEPDGLFPFSGLLKATDGRLYGTTNFGGIYPDSSNGSSGNGTIFGISPDGSGYAVLHSFSTANQQTSTNADGRWPLSSLLQGVDGALYGTASYGGQNNFGTIFKVGLDGTFTTLHSFTGYTLGDGNSPIGGLTQSTTGALFGTTAPECYACVPNPADYGVLYELQPNGASYSVLVNYAQTGIPSGSSKLLSASDGKLYGVGTNQLYRLEADGSGYTVIYTFSSTTGPQFRPNDNINGLIEGSDGFLYGTSPDGGSSGNGTIYKIAKDGSGLKVLRSFGGSDGAYPRSALVAGSNGLFYGSTYNGGTNGTGTLFSVKTDGTFQSLFSFSSVNKYSKNQQGAHPVNLLVYSNGYLYGTAATAGQTSFGTVFSLKVQ